MTGQDLIFDPPSVRRAVLGLASYLDREARWDEERVTIVPILTGGLWTMTHVLGALSARGQHRAHILPLAISRGAETLPVVTPPEGLVVVVDDFVDTGTTLSRTARNLRTKCNRVITLSLVERQGLADELRPNRSGLLYAGDRWLYGCGMDRSDGTGRWAPMIFGEEKP